MPGRLTEERVRLIMVDPRSDAELAAAFGVCADSVAKVRRGVTWRHVTGLTRRVYRPRLGHTGEDSPRATLGVESARKIYRDKRAYKLIAQEHGVSYGTVRNIKRGQRWRHATIDLPRPAPWYKRRQIRKKNAKN